MSFSSNNKFVSICLAYFINVVRRMFQTAASEQKMVAKSFKQKNSRKANQEGIIDIMKNGREIEKIRVKMTPPIYPLIILSFIC